MPNQPARFAYLVEQCRSLLLIALKLSTINSSNTHLFARLSRELASRTEAFSKDASQTKGVTHAHEQLLNGFIISTAGRVQKEVLEVLKAAKSVISNPESYLGKQEVAKKYEALSKSLLYLVVNLFLAKKSRAESLTPEIFEMVNSAQLISEFAVSSQQKNSPKNTAGFNDSMTRFLSVSRKIIRNGGQDDLLQAAEVFLLSNNKREADATKTLTKFQQEAKQQLIVLLEEVLVVSVLHRYTKKIGKYVGTGEHAGISKTVFNTFQYLQLLANDIQANTSILYMCKRMPEFRIMWSGTPEAKQQEILDGLVQQIPTPDSLQFFNIHSSKSYTNAMDDDDDSKAETTTESTPPVQASSVDVKKDTEKKSPRGPRSSTVSAPSLRETGRGRMRDKRKSITITKKCLRTFLKKKPSIVDDLINDSMQSQLDNAKQLNKLSLMTESTADVHEIELESNTYNDPSPSMKIIPVVEDLPGLIQSFNSAVFLIAELGTMGNAQSIKKNHQEATKLLEILAKCNMWASGTRIENLPPSRVEKIEVQIVQQNYIDLSKTIDTSPDTSILVGCVIDGWYVVHNQLLRNLQECRTLMCALSTQITSLFTTFHKGDISQPTFLFLEVCIQRFAAIIKDFLQAQEDYSLIMEDAEKHQKIKPKTSLISLWEEAKTRNKFDVESPKTLTKASINSLIEALTDVTVVETEFNSILFLTYRAYLHPQTLLDKLFERFNVPEQFKRQASRIQFRALVAIREMIKTCPDDIDASMLDQLEEFAKDESQFIGPGVNMAKALGKDVETMKEERSKVKPPAPVHSLKSLQRSDSVHFLSLDTTKLAQMITLVDSELYSKIRSWELLRTAWSQKKYYYRSVNVIHLIQRLNRFTIWVAALIVWPTSLKQRIDVMEKLIRIAKLFLQYNNYHSLMGIYAAFEISAVARLKHTFAGVKKKLRAFLDEMRALFDQSSSWKNYREAFKNVGPPAVPYLGISLTDLVYIEDGNKTLLEDGRINFTKQKLVAKVIKSVLQYQSPAHDFPISPVEYTFTREFSFMAETPLYSLSLKREPRDCSVKDLES